MDSIPDLLQTSSVIGSAIQDTQTVSAKSLVSEINYDDDDDDDDGGGGGGGYDDDDDDDDDDYLASYLSHTSLILKTR